MPGNCNLEMTDKLTYHRRTLVCVEGEARTYSRETEEGQKFSGLNVIQRMSIKPCVQATANRN